MENKNNKNNNNGKKVRFSEADILETLKKYLDMPISELEQGGGNNTYRRISFDWMIDDDCTTQYDYLITMLASGYGLDAAKMRHNMTCGELAYVLMHAGSNPNFVAEDANLKPEKTSYRNMLSGMLLDCLLDKYDTNSTVKAILDIDYDDFMEVARRTSESEEIDAYLERVDYNITDSLCIDCDKCQTIGDIARELSRRIHTAWYPGTVNKGTYIVKKVNCGVVANYLCVDCFDDFRMIPHNYDGAEIEEKYTRRVPA